MLHLQVAGEHVGATVVLDAGAGGFSPLFACCRQSSPTRRRSWPTTAAAADLPEPATARLTALTATAAYWRASSEEAGAFSALAAATPPGLDDVPTRVVSATRAAPGEQDLLAALDTLHRELVDDSALASHHEVVGADHLTLLTGADDARETARLVTELLDDLALP